MQHNQQDRHDLISIELANEQSCIIGDPSRVRQVILQETESVAEKRLVHVIYEAQIDLPEKADQQHGSTGKENAVPDPDRYFFQHSQYGL